MSAGKPAAEALDTIFTIDISERFGRFLPSKSHDTKSGVMPEVLERVVALAFSLSVEGREGTPVGTIFIVGDTKKVASYTKQLVINPFRSYRADTLNVLDPILEETIKEFAAIDGAFIIRGDGVILSAGTYLAPPPLTIDIPGGLGTRHTAACAITAVTHSYAVVISKTAGKVTVFRNGAVFVVIERPEWAQE